MKRKWRHVYTYLNLLLTPDMVVTFVQHANINIILLADTVRSRSYFLHKVCSAT
jgi:hypothetical protein